VQGGGGIIYEFEQIGLIVFHIIDFGYAQFYKLSIFFYFYRKRNSMQAIQMVDLKGQYLKIKPEIDQALQNVIDEAAFIKGKQVKDFEKEIATYIGGKHCISCANGTDALQIALMALDLKEGDEVIVPAFTYIATVETAALLRIKIVLVDVCPDTFNIDPLKLERAITHKTKAIIPVHLYGQCADMESILNIARKHGLWVIEDAAQGMGAIYMFANGSKNKAGNIGTIGCTSFFPSKNLGCFGDGGALFTNDDALAQKISMIANHGQAQKYIHELIGINSRLDTLQAAILSIKLKKLDAYIVARQKAAEYYDLHLDQNKVTIPQRSAASSHVFHQYTVKVKNKDRDLLKAKLQENGIPSMVYYPLPVHLQPAFSGLGYKSGDFPIAEQLCSEVISLPMHTELSEEQLAYITKQLNLLA
jgi:UDP-2-acetamido-2-deoxy-ribo-hexuluronate aminotransferase